MFKNLILIGGGGHATACIDVIRAEGRYDIIGYTDFTPTLDVKFDIPFLGDDDTTTQYIHTAVFLICVGQMESYLHRQSIFKTLSERGAQFATVVSPHSMVSRYAQIESGTIILHGVVVQANSKVGKNCIINDKALIEHGCVVGDHCHISTNSVLNGDVVVGNGVFIGSSATIKNNIQIGTGAIIGMGSNVLKDVPANQRWVGNPAKAKK